MKIAKQPDMHAPTLNLSPSAARIFLDTREETHAILRDFIKEVAPRLNIPSEDWLETQLRSAVDLVAVYVSEGNAETLRPRMRAMSTMAIEIGLQVEDFARIMLSTSARVKQRLVERLAGDSHHEIVDAFNALDHYERTLFDEFARTQADYWRRREQAAVRRHADFFTQTLFPALTGDADLVIREVNPAGLRDLGIRRDQAVGYRFDQWLDLMNLSKKRGRQLIEKLKEQGHLVHEPIQISCPNGCEEKHLLLTFNFSTDDSGRRTGFNAMIQDMTERRRLEEQIESQMRQLDAVFQSSPVGLIYVDSGRVIQRINNEACRLLGYPPPDQVLRSDMKSFREQASKSYKEPEKFKSLLEKVYGDPESSSVGIFELVNPSRLVSYSVSPVHNERGAPMGWFWIFTDVTDRVRRDQLRNDLTHMIVHDLKNPLTAIQGSLHVLRRVVGPENVPAYQSIDIARRNAARLLGMVMNLLDIERLEQGKLELKREKIDPVAMLQGVIDAEKPAAAERELILEVDPKLEGVTLFADMSLIERVVMNLVSNAIKHTRPGTGRIVLHARGDARGYLMIDVVDNGDGIDPKYHEKIFERFGQAEARQEGANYDTGLGLTFCKLAVEAHGGRIGVTSAPGQGATFHLRLPGLLLDETVV